MRVSVIAAQGRLLVAYLDSKLLPGTQAVWQGDGEPLLPAELQRVCVLTGQKLERYDAHSHQLVLVELLKALGDDCAYPLFTAKKQVSGTK